MTASDVEDDHSRSASPDDSGTEHVLNTMAERQPKDSKQQKTGSQATNLKDPSRPRRKKARRACYACQRAHLTCGDERPCQRCIKRGLQDACQDGVRKKAKYLHDAPNEALMPGVAGNLFNPPPTKRSSTINSDTSSQQPFFQQPQQTFNNFQNSSQMPPPMVHERSMSSASFNHQSPIANNFTNIGGSVALQSPVIGTDQNTANGLNAAGWNGPFLDDQSMFHFDTASMNFGNHYGALEFGMLGHMATNAGETPPSDSATVHRGSMNQQQYRMPLGSFSESPTARQQFYNDTMMSDWSNGTTDPYAVHAQGRSMAPNAFTIESNNATHWTSPDTNGTPGNGVKFEDSPLLTNQALQVPPTSIENGSLNQQLNTSDNRTRQPPPISTPQLKAKSQFPVKAIKRPRDPSSIYTSVTQPHSYTAGFHTLIAYLQRRFQTHPSKTLAIAKSLASIRPSFIATTKTLNREDLIFMEKCFQRTLWEYEGFIEGVGTPTIVARRTGEIAAVGKEFQILTGWTKSVLLGRAPNLNVNKGHTGTTPAGGSGPNTARNTGFNTPTQRTVQDENGEKKSMPVLLAELLDDDSVVQFYEDFARLAFGDSRGSVLGRGKLLKYRTKDDELAQNLNAEAEARNEEGKTNGGTDSRRQDLARRQDMKKDGISGEKGMQKLGSADGKVDCTYCWTVKRDVFDIPMLIVMNFLPCI
ncbi:Transcriptional regulator of nonfermentable carbon utilization [Elasticomyces elasticus]|uniref:Transcriptional regulator of nonfermentable carbon utilization n=1 Tax=Exophiala sideris TaxID=1016849 RepID=A0ABR0JHG1_9EURO|nr:Transcriptional regulator of nonfermentable carbon utilization [Elasticomyces elasticus]KAK5025378.1 Transcriptional regulator of nonfermentable carbon utilization [Exophiala sideris]KAK5032953.1 Transcriptional regulator of nonfermentable carbon utilization [Exophiala sideris]KAK5063438.1 Transcriptional regulator of nonfermentable carbon utilization [Exophiala sideris]KAK5180730.1 Transcriptional regulator of nonfermentable carbon utilization [Eurotiomycetes sp. CCFEE 6388]